MIVKCMLCRENNIGKILTYDSYIICIYCRNDHQRTYMNMTTSRWRRLFITYLNDRLS